MLFDILICKTNPEKSFDSCLQNFIKLKMIINIFRVFHARLIIVELITKTERKREPPFVQRKSFTVTKAVKYLKTLARTRGSVSDSERAIWKFPALRQRLHT